MEGGGHAAWRRGRVRASAPLAEESEPNDSLRITGSTVKDARAASFTLPGTNRRHANRPRSETRRQLELPPCLALLLVPADAHIRFTIPVFVCLFVFCFRATMAFERCIRKEMQLRHPKSAMLLAEKFRI